MQHQPAPAPAPASVTRRPFGRTLLSLVTLGSLWIVQPIHRPSDPIIRRHDVPDSLYVQLGAGTRASYTSTSRCREARPIARVP